MQYMQACFNLGGRLFEHDRQIAVNSVRASFESWHDCLIAGVILFVAVVVGRAWFGDRPWEITAWAALGIGAYAGMGTGRIVSARIAFHSFDGVLAADAVQPEYCRRYSLAWHAIGMMTLAAVTLIVRPSLIFISLPAYVAGVLAAGLTTLLPLALSSGKAAGRWKFRRWLLRPSAGIVAAVVFILSLLAAHALKTNMCLPVIGVEAVFLIVVLATIDQDVVRFRAWSGHGPWRIVVSHSSRLLLFEGITMPVCWLILGAAPTGLVLVASAAMLLFMAMRILTSCVHGNRLADMLVWIFFGMLMLVAYSMIVLAPVVAVAVLWHLYRRAAARTWLLA